jgi:hypothetical protein
MPKRGDYFRPWSGAGEVRTTDLYGASEFMSVWIFSCVCVAQSIKSTNCGIMLWVCLQNGFLSQLWNHSDFLFIAADLKIYRTNKEYFFSTFFIKMYTECNEHHLNYYIYWGYNLLNLLTVALCYGSVYKMVSYLIGGVLYLVNLVPRSVIWDNQPLGPLLMVNG